MSNNTTPKELVIDTLNTLNYVFDTRTGWKVKDSVLREKQNQVIIAGHIRNHLRGIGSEFVPCEKEIITQLLIIEETLKNGRNKECHEKIKYNPASKDNSEELCRLICGNKYNPVYPSIIRQWMYGVKSKMNERIVKGWIFPIFYGSGGVYKSTFIQCLCSPLPEHKYAFIRSGDSLINDDRHASMLHEYLVLHLDEMAGMGKADLAKVKSLDAPYVSHRVLGTHAQSRGFNMASLIGASNDEVRTMLNSTHDIRKWVQIDFYDADTEEERRATGEKIKAFDYLSLWQSINENGTEPFDDAPTYDRFRKYVDEVCRANTPTTEWIDEYIQEHSGEWVERTEMYKEYVRECVMETKHQRSDLFYQECRKRKCEDRIRQGTRGFSIPAKPTEETF